VNLSFTISSHIRRNIVAGVMMERNKRTFL
jgi:hypothetical protein